MSVAPNLSFFVIPNANAVATPASQLNKINNTPAPGSALSTGYDNFGNVGIGSTFTVYRQVWNNYNGGSDVSTATDLRITLHRSMTLAEAVAASSSATHGEEDGAPAAGPPNVIVDEGINPPSTFVDQNQWVIGGTGPGASAASVPEQLWTRVTCVRQGDAVTSDTGGYIGYLLNGAPSPSYQFHELPGSIDIPGTIATNPTNRITLKLETTIPNTYTGTGLLYSRLHLEFKFV